MNDSDLFRPGLEGVIAAETRLSHVDGERGELLLAGYPLEEVAPAATFEALVYTLWYGARPDAAALATFGQQVAACRSLPAATLALLAAAAAAQRPPIDALRMAAGTFDLDLPPTPDPEAHARVLLARMPVALAAYWRLRHGASPVAPDADLGHAANFLLMLTGSPPDAAHVRALETYLNSVIDHGLNASTFAARVIIATQSDLTAAVVGALGALKGPLHGGAPGPALDTVLAIGTPERAEPLLRAQLARGERLMGFGHRVYKVYDPRAAVLSAAAADFYAAAGDRSLYALARHVEQVALALLAEAKPGRRLQTNVEYYTALLLHGIGLETALFTPTFAIARTAGWIAHCREQQASGRLIRPQSRYVGPRRSWAAAHSDGEANGQIDRRPQRVGDNAGAV